MTSTFLQHPAVKDLLDRLDRDKDPFIQETTDAIAALVSKKNTAECLGLVARDEKGNVRERYPANLNIDFASALTLFCFRRTYKGNRLDSALTDEIVSLFQSRYERYISNHNDEVAAALFSALASNNAVANKLTEALLSNKAFKLASKEIKKGIRDQILVVLTQKATSSTVAHVVTGKVSAGTAAIASTQIASVLAQKLMLILGHKIGYLVAKAMAMPAVKVAIAVAVKKVVFAAVIATFFKLFAAKLGVGVSGLVLIVVAPIILALLVHEWNHFPRKLGQGIASSLREEIGTSFRSTTETVLKEIWGYLLSKGVGEIELELAGSEEIAKAAGLARKVLTT